MAGQKANQNKRSNSLVLCEGLLIAYCGYLAQFILISLELADSAPLDVTIINAGTITVIMLLCSLSVGLYESKLRESFRGIIRRIFVSAGFTYLIQEVFFNSILASYSMNAYYPATVLSMVIVSQVCFRYLTVRLGLLGLGKRRIVVLGAGERASIIERRMRRNVDRIGFELLGFIPVVGDNREDGIKNEKIIHLRLSDALQLFLTDNNVEEIVIACDQRRGTLPIDVLFESRLRGIEVTDLLDFMERETGQIVVNLMFIRKLKTFRKNQMN